MREYVESIDPDLLKSREKVTTQKISKFQPEGEDEEIRRYERYDHIPSNHKQTAPNISLGDPVFLNPDSYANLTLVLRNIGINAGLHRYGGNLRYWVIVCCDGLPFRLCYNLIKETRVCIECNKSFFGLDKFSDHCKSEHDNMMELYYEFDWVLLRPCGGHIEMSAIKSFFELNGIPFLKTLCDLMGFKSEAAHCAKKCTDHHKASSLLLIFYIDSLQEMVFCYLKALSDGEFPEKKYTSKTSRPTAEGFLSYSKTREGDPQFMCMFSQTLHYAQAIINYRMGICRNNARLIKSALFKFMDLFHGRNHPTYQHIESYLMLLDMSCPAELKIFWTATFPSVQATILAKAKTGISF